MRLTEFLRRDLTLAGLEADGIEDAFHQIAEHLAGLGAVQSAGEVESLLLAREHSHTTVLRGGLAIPHTTLTGLPSPMLIVVTAARPIPSEGEDVEPVRVFFVVLSPPGYEGEHIRLLARICRLALHHGFIEELQVAPDAASAIEVIERVDDGRATS
jgi:mannitol/fructose-specific phosphotransferase system IIA component (Ntr-type)